MVSVERMTGPISVLREERGQDLDRILENSGGRSRNTAAIAVTARLYFLSRISEHSRSYSNSPFAGSFTRRHVKYVTYVCETFHLLLQVVCNVFFQGAIVPPC